MNRETRRLMEREERLQKKQKPETDGRQPGSRAPATAGSAGQPARRLAGSVQQPVHRRLFQFLHEVRVELKKVSWPTRDQMIAFTTVTLITSLVLTAVVFVLDIGLKELVFFVIGGVNG